MEVHYLLLKMEEFGQSTRKQSALAYPNRIPTVPNTHHNSHSSHGAAVRPSGRECAPRPTDRCNLQWMDGLWSLIYSHSSIVSVPKKTDKQAVLRVTRYLHCASVSTIETREQEKSPLRSIYLYWEDSQHTIVFLMLILGKLHETVRSLTIALLIVSNL